MSLHKNSNSCEKAAPSTSSADSPAAQDFSLRFSLWILLGLAAAIALMRLHTYYEPIERDSGGYSVIADNILHGGRFFDGFAMDQKPPLVHCTWAFAQLIAGYGRGSIYLLNVLSAITCMLGYFVAGRLITRRNSLGLWMAAIWTVISGHLTLEANQPNTESFTNVMIVLGTCLLARLGGNEKRVFTALAAGICFAAATFYKQVNVVIPFFIGCAYITFPPSGRNRLSAFVDILVIGAVGTMAWGLMICYFWVTGRLENLILAMVTFNSYYASIASHSGGPLDNIIRSLDWKLLFPPSLYFSLPLLLLGITGICLSFLKRRYFPWNLLLGMAVGTQIAVALPGRFYPHYYQLWFPFLVIGAGWGLDAIEKFTEITTGAIKGIAATVLIILILAEAPDYISKSPEDWSRAKYGEIFVRNSVIAAEINRILLPKETFFQFGSECQLYLATGRRCNSVVCDYYAAEGPMAEMQTRLMFEEFEKAPPDLFLIEKWTPLKPTHPLLPWLQARYSQVTILDFDPFYVFVLKGSALETRLGQTPAAR